MTITALVGGQFGSEGKGLIAGHIAKDYGHHVRVGAANAGHTVWTPTELDREHNDDVPVGWEKHVMQQIPCAAYANPDAQLYIGPGAQISPDIFLRELQQWAQWRRARDLPDAKVLVDYRAHVITGEHIGREQDSDLAERIGSTSTIAKEGIGAAQAARVMREASCYTAEAWRSTLDQDVPILLADVPWALATRSAWPYSAADRAASIERIGGRATLLEGTQGTGLSLTTGFFPYTTSRNTTAAGLCADAGVAPNEVGRVILVCRTYPIRVAGNSGPFHEGSREIRWDDIEVDFESERTTVTKKVRRVATFSLDQVQEAVYLNGATEIALTFCDYLEPNLAGAKGPARLDAELAGYKNLRDLITEIEQYCGAPVTMLGTGPCTVIDIQR